MENGTYFFFEDSEIADRQSLGGLFVYNPKVDNEIYLYCMEFYQFYKNIEHSQLAGYIDFKRPQIVPVPFKKLINSPFKDNISGVLDMLNGQVKSVIRF